MRRLTVLLALLAILAGACSSGSDEDATTTTAARSTTGPGGADGSIVPAAFEIPHDLIKRVKAKGFDVVDVDYPAQPAGVPWPTREWPTGPLPDGVDSTAVNQTIHSAFTGGAGDTDVIDAVLVVAGGKLVLARYNGWDPEGKHNSWSMAKSITQSLVGILAGRGEIDVFDRAGAPEWKDPADPRHDITLDELLRMSSGLQWAESYDDPKGDVLTILGGSGKEDRAGYTASKPLEAEPDTKWEYSTGTADIIAREVAQKVGFGDDYVSWIQQNLFDPLGIPGAEHQVDAAGVINGGSWINLRPVDFARFGYLYLRGGQWDGKQLIPERFIDYSRLATPTQDEPAYGAQWWLDEDRPGVFYANGFNGQTITVVPQKDLVIVVLSRSTTDRPDVLQDDLLNLFAGPAQG